jgi:hypothetical protein
MESPATLLVLNADCLYHLVHFCHPAEVKALARTSSVLHRVVVKAMWLAETKRMQRCATIYDAIKEKDTYQRWLDELQRPCPFTGSRWLCEQVFRVEDDAPPEILLSSKSYERACRLWLPVGSFRPADYSVNNPHQLRGLYRAYCDAKTPIFTIHYKVDLFGPRTDSIYVVESTENTWIRIFYTTTDKYGEGFYHRKEYMFTEPLGDRRALLLNEPNNIQCRVADELEEEFRQCLLSVGRDSSEES